VRQGPIEDMLSALDDTSMLQHLNRGHRARNEHRAASPTIHENVLRLCGAFREASPQIAAFIVWACVRCVCVCVMWHVCKNLIKRGGVTLGVNGSLYTGSKSLFFMGYDVMWAHTVSFETEASCVLRESCPLSSKMQECSMLYAEVYTVSRSTNRADPPMRFRRGGTRGHPLLSGF
jgi:hypothetical protein